ncbi:winged helix-turn-helix transcriptional regulator [Neisseria wadsworthii]|uniref:Transcriptional regulator n=1 Tax=Neisseria wadsworthii 9715 TaxID=1030841 RepID=G4CTT7_9NEIS|nr:helix-turn-helix domain-containing protein [Neisseria wadsworthii]EGZ43858.1 transcriptional regulator [Neisseria wadsworthii 9715]QMT36059.1 helix-turn-helix transcriptional regulator [Neisseria wadsworthii]
MIKTPCNPLVTDLADTGFGYTLSLIGGKYKMLIMYWLHKKPPVMRFNELKRCVGSISFKTLSITLKELENDGLVIRTEYPQVSPKVEYGLSEKGQSLMPVLDMMCRWGNEQKNMPV